MKLLVSVVDADEARAAAAAGADIVDVKNPAEGSLGAPSPAVIADVRAAVPAELPVSAAIGDMPNLPGTAALAALGAAQSGATFVKVGLWGVSTEPDAVALLRAVREVLRRAGRGGRGGGLRGRRSAWPTRRSRPSCCRASRARRASGSACSTPPSRTAAGCWSGCSPDALASLVADAHAAGLQVALAGALRPEDLPVVRDTGADIAGVRSAACRDDRRTGAPRRGARPRPDRRYAGAGDSMS